MLCTFPVPLGFVLVSDRAVQAYPLDLVRTRLAAQTQGHYYNGISSTLRCIVADEGVTGLYRGLGATLLQVSL